MQRSRLKNIINKSKSNSISAFDKFKSSLPKEVQIDDNYRLEAAWKAYGSPVDYRHALWEGMIQPLDENTYKLPSIGYNEETDEYEYLNKGKDNETVAKDIRVWDNDVIPFVKELKQGGFIRVYNDEKDCWTYTKNINYLQKGKPIKVKSDQSYYDPENNTIYYSGNNRKERKESLTHEMFHADPDNELVDFLKPYYENLDDNKIQELGGDLNFVKRQNNDPNYYYSPEEIGARLSAAFYRTRNVQDYSPNFFEKLRQNENKYGDNMRDLLHMYNNDNLSKMFTYLRNKSHKGWFVGGNNNIFIDNNGEIGDGMPLKPTGRFAPDGQEYYESASGDLYTLQPQAFKQGGQMNVIPEGALHARKNNMEGAGEDFTAKGIPVISTDTGEQQAEIERNEIIFNKEVTDFIEENYKKFKSDETSNSQKDELAIKVGKRLVKEILENTQDNTGLIQDVQEKM